MAIKKSDRFENASDFRRALEKIKIYCDWKINRKGRVITYYTKIKNVSYKVIIMQNKDERFSITTIKTTESGTERRITNDCHSKMTLLQMKKQIRHILPRYVEKGK